MLKKASKILDSACKRELKRQGHILTGSLENSITGKLSGNRVIGTMHEYGFIVNDGVKAKKIPYGGGESSGGKSKYIEGLIAFFKLRGLSEDDAKKAAFATAKVQKNEGMSTIASRKYSKTKERQKFLDIALSNSVPKVDEIITSGMDDIFNKEFLKQKDELI